MEEKYVADFDSLPEEGKKEVLSKLLFEKIRAETKQRLQTDASIQKYFSQFKKHSVDFFINMYAVYKAVWMTSAESLSNASEFVDMKYDKAAKYALALILKRKAMQKIAEWNAYQADFEGIETSVDFALWDADIFNVPFIEPIERQEVDIYIKYFLGPNYSEDDMMSLPTSYLIYRRDASQSPDDDASNDFCVLYDTLKGAGTYLILPPDKTTIERSYEDKLRNHRVAEQEREIAEGKKQPYVRDER
ncbi:MAG: hypothetical protein JJE25_06010, partial [Bacteroidia bacterium]|nr:hypothetical protein [Bacteroidia bacterium]